MTGIHKMRTMVKTFDCCRESFNERFTITELERIYDCLRKCKWDVFPDNWSEQQIHDAINHGVVPEFPELDN